MKPVYIFLIMFLSVLTIFLELVIADNSNFCKSINNVSITETCSNFNCESLDFSIINGNKISQNLIGDYFTYQIRITNIGNTVVNDKLTINIFNPSGVSINPIREFPINLKHSENQIIFPNVTISNVTQNYNVYSIDSVGVYKIYVFSRKPTLFLRFYPDCSFTYYQNSFNYTFDSTTTWQYQLQKISEENLRESSQLLKATKILVGLTAALLFIEFGGLIRNEVRRRWVQAVLIIFFFAFLIYSILV